MSEDTTLSRRSMLTVAAAGMAVAACSGKDAATGEKPGSPMQDKGINPSFGDPPNDGFPKPADAPYTPKYMTLVRVSSQKKWDITTNHASFLVPPTLADPVKDAKNRLDQACAIFAKFKGSLKRFSELMPGGIVERSPGKYDAVDFNDFNFGWQHDIYIWFDSEDVLLHAVSGKDHLIEMTPFTAAGAGTTFNKSFYASNVSTQIPASLGGKMILVRNYLRDENGKSLRDGSGQPVDPTKNYPFSMNIFFELIRKGGKNLVVILDPDTGNGTGYDPLIGA